MGRLIASARAPTPSFDSPFVPVTTALLIDECALRVAFKASSEYQVFNIGSLRGALGSAAHRVLEDQATLSRYDGEELVSRFGLAWSSAVDNQRTKLDRQQRLRPVPSPDRWPAYSRTRRGVFEIVRSRKRGFRRSSLGGSHVQNELAIASQETGLSARIDRVVNTVEGVVIIDFKTGRSASVEERESHRQQVRLYAYLWHESTGEWPSRCEIRYLDGETEVVQVDSAVLIEMAVSYRDKLRLLRRTLENSSGLDNSQIGPRTANTCRFCSYRAVCSRRQYASESAVDGAPRDLEGEVTGMAASGSEWAITIDTHAGTVPFGSYQVIVTAEVACELRSGDHLALLNLRGNPSSRTLHAAFDAIGVKLSS